MKTSWKKRLKKMLADGEFYGLMFGGTAGIGGFLLIFTGLIGAGIFGWKFSHTIEGTFTASFLFSLLIALTEVFGKTSSYDQKIREEEEKEKIDKRLKEERVKQARESERKKGMETLRKIIMLLEKKNEHLDMTNILKDIENKMKLVLEKNPLDAKEEHYLTRSLPNDLIESIGIFMELNEENQREMKEKMMDMLIKKQHQLDEHFIDRFQNEMKEKLSQRITLTETRDY